MTNKELMKLEQKKRELEEKLMVRLTRSDRFGIFLILCVGILFCVSNVYAGIRSQNMELRSFMRYGWLAALLILMMFLNRKGRLKDKRRMRDYDEINDTIQLEERNREWNERLKKAEQNKKQDDLVKRKSQSTQNARLKAIRIKEGNN